MLRTLLLILILVFSKISYAQQFYSDHGTPLLPPVPCDCNNWHNESMDKIDSLFNAIYTEFYEKEGKKYKRVYYVTQYDTTWKDVCDEPANCKGAKRIRITYGNRYWHTDEPDCGTLKSNEVCCEGLPVDVSKCCNGKNLKDNEVCCDGQPVDSSKCCKGKVLKDNEVCCDGQPVDSSKCCKGKVLKGNEVCCDEQPVDSSKCCKGKILPDGEVCDSNACKLISFFLPCCINELTQVKDVAHLIFSHPCPNQPPVTFDPKQLRPSSFPNGGSQTVTAKSGNVSITASTLVVNENIATTYTPINFNFNSLGKSFQNAINAITGGGCKPTGNIIPSGSIGFQTSDLCCSGISPCVKTSYKYSGSLSWNYGISRCHFPIFGCPFASIDGVLTAAIAGSVAVNYQTTCNTNKFCTGINGSLTIGIGLGVSLLRGFVSADLQCLVSGSSFKANVCFYPTFERRASFAIGQASIVGTVSEFWGLTSHSVSWVFFNGWTSQDFTW